VTKTTFWKKVEPKYTFKKNTFRKSVAKMMYKNRTNVVFGFGPTFSQKVVFSKVL
jgi:hypothetical protein